MNTEESNTFNPTEFTFVTMFTYRRRKVFISADVNDILCDALEYHVENGNVKISGYVIMPEHVHILLRPGGIAVHQFVNNFKSYTGIRVKEAAGFRGRVWRPRFFSQPIENEDDFAERLELVHQNPVKKQYADTPGDYPWSSYGAYHGGDAKVPVLVVPIG